MVRLINDAGIDRRPQAQAVWLQGVGSRPGCLARAKRALCVERSKIALKFLFRKVVREPNFYPSDAKARAFARAAPTRLGASRPGKPMSPTNQGHWPLNFGEFHFRLGYDDSTTSIHHTEASMAILAVCPFCKQGKVRAPDTAVGMSATCPSCHNCFTIAASSEPAAKAGPARTAVAAKAAIASPAKPAVSDPTPLPAGIISDETLESEAVPPLPAEPAPEPRREKIAIMTYRPAPEPETESIFSLAMFAFILAGAALFASQITRYGRYATVALAMLGVFLAFLALISAYRGRRWPALALAANLLTILLITVLPGWLALDSWWPAKVVNDAGMTKVRPLNGGASGMLEGGWLDVSQGAWQRDDMLIAFSRAWVGKVEMVGPKDKRQVSKSKALVVGLKFTNVGAARRIEYRSWQRPAPPDAPLPVATDSTGKVLAAMKIDEGWEVPSHATNGTMLPGKSHEDWLLFEAPDPKAEYVRLELPSWAFGDKGEPVRLHIPKSLIGAR